MAEKGKRVVELQMKRVPPPERAPRQQRAHELGLLDGLRVEDDRGSPWRCGQCRKLQDGPIVWVPDNIRIGDDPEIVREVCRLNAFNGHSSGWCFHCARKLTPKIDAFTDARLGFWDRIRVLLTGSV